MGHDQRGVTMRDTNAEVKAFLESHIKPTSRKADVLKALNRLQRQGMYVKDASDEIGYPNYRVRTAEGYVRVYERRRDGWQIQCWETVEFRYSGIPTFFGGGLL